MVIVILYTIQKEVLSELWHNQEATLHSMPAISYLTVIRGLTQLQAVHFSDERCLSRKERGRSKKTLFLMYIFIFWGEKASQSLKQTSPISHSPGNNWILAADPPQVKENETALTPPLEPGMQQPEQNQCSLNMKEEEWLFYSIGDFRWWPQ